MKTILVRHSEDGAAMLAIAGEDTDASGLTFTTDGYRTLAPDDDLWGRPAAEVPDGIYDENGKSLEHRKTGDAAYQDWVAERYGTSKGQGG